MALSLHRVVAGARTRLARVRVRLTVVATALLAVGLAIAAGVMLLVLHQSLLSTADGVTRARASEIADALRTTPVASLDAGVLAPTTSIDLIQVVDADGRVLVATPGDRDVPLAAPGAAGSTRTLDDARIAGDDDTKYRATARAVSTPGGVVTVIVAAAEGPIDRVLLIVAAIVAAVFPLILVMIAVATYVLSGRTLAPVERIRARVAAITGSGLDQRVPVPTTRDEIADLAETMNAMLDRLDAAHRRHVQFVGDASHELRSPLVTLLGLLDLAASRGDGVDQATVAQVLLPEARRLHDLIDDLLLLARSDESATPLPMSDVDLDDVVDADVRRLRDDTPVTVTAEVHAIRVRGDREALTRALRNLTDNAVRHARTSVRITMSQNYADGVATIDVDDDGPGIPAHDRGRVIERFTRLDEARSRGDAGGSGLGLAIVTEIARAHGGSLTIDDSPLGGTRARLTIPVDGIEDAQSTATSR
ncbi:ATP-binding protein [Williamsia serinedens]|uniref:histidine kinase n=1 Tax=Williamsia serinedens TaxID=391736 RepID=A0ABT1H033_9NOCA|nr:ATP-binding protein [Williamsia serinedens]MCP2160137.1 Signal transduction histidine kinase [Williamsia serinedens]